MSTGLFFLLSIGILGGIISATLLKKVRTPHIVGYIVTGLIIGQSGFKIVTLSDLEKLESFNFFALALIGFLVGAEIKFTDFRRYGKQFSAILFGEGFGAFILVTILTGGVLYYVSQSWNIALAGGLIFGAISSATDPASTMSVLWENRAAGILTTTIIAVIALDDALAMSLYGLFSGLVQILVKGSANTLTYELLKVAFELFGSLIAGLIIGLITIQLIRKLQQNEKAVTVSFGLFLLSIALSKLMGLDVIIVAMTAGIIISNKESLLSEHFFNFMKGIANPVYILFFVFTGARLTLGSMPHWLWIIVGLYIIGRSLGKITGSFLGARVSGAGKNVKRYTGLGLISQGGVVIGLSILAGHHLNTIPITDDVTLGDAVISTIAATTFLIQLIGPLTVNTAIRLSGEGGLNITIDDLIKERKVKDVLFPSVPLLLREHTTVSEAIHIFSSEDADFIPVVDDNNVLIGVVTFENLREILPNPALWSWSLVTDIMSYEVATAEPDQSLDAVLQLAHSINYSRIPVVKEGKLISMLKIREIEKNLRNELIKKQEQAFVQ